MNNLDKEIKKFSGAIQKTKDYQDYKKATEIYNNDKEAQKLLKDFQEAQRTSAIFQQGDFPGMAEQRAKTEGLLNEVRKNKVINDLINTKRKAQGVISEMAITLSNDLDLNFAPPQRGGCCG